MQQVALQWLVWRLTHRERVLGPVAFLGQFPVFVLGALSAYTVRNSSILTPRCACETAFLRLILPSVCEKFRVACQGA